MRRKHRVLIVAAAVAMLVSGCRNNVFYSHSESVDDRGWSLDDSRNFHIDITDTTQLYDFYVDLRVTNQYPYSNFFFFITTQHPDGALSSDTLECPLAAPDGSWLGRSSGRFVSNRYYFRKNVRFPQQGVYQFSVIHGMRDSAITGVHDIGFHIEYAE